MTILFFCAGDDDNHIQTRLRDALPDQQIIAWPGVYQPADIEYAVVWKPPEDFFDDLTGLKAIFSLGAGVDHVLRHPGLPSAVPLIRLEDAGMAEKMEEYVLYGVLHAHRNMHRYRIAQNNQLWDEEPIAAHARDFHVAILGLGILGQRVAQRLLNNGYQVSGWSRTPRQNSPVRCLHGEDGLSELLPAADALVCLLPLTPETHGLLDGQIFERCKPGCFLINVARGGHVDTDALLTALDRGQLSGALLDVTDPEPLPAHSRLWRHPGVLITPHIAAPTQIHETIEQVATNLQKFIAGTPVSGLVDPQLGY